MKKTILSCFALIFALTLVSSTAFAQKETATGVTVERDLELLRRDLRAEKKKIIALNVPLTEDEATKFWPLYDQYAADMTKHYNEFYALVKEYAANSKTISDAQATSMLKRWSEIQLALAQTRAKHIPIIEKVLPGRKAAHFFQIDRRLYELMDLQVTTEIPLVIQ